MVDGRFLLISIQHCFQIYLKTLLHNEGDRTYSSRTVWQPDWSKSNFVLNTFKNILRFLVKKFVYIHITYFLLHLVYYFFLLISLGMHISNEMYTPVLRSVFLVPHEFRFFVNRSAQEPGQ